MHDNPWDLYEDHPRFAEATAAIDRAWEEAKLLAPGLPSADRANMAERYMYDALTRFMDVGALDSEPVRAVRGKVCRHFGMEGDWL
jgi:hypothetical protein